jgi:hypothetical protein
MPNTEKGIVRLLGRRLSTAPANLGRASGGAPIIPVARWTGKTTIGSVVAPGKFAPHERPRIASGRGALYDEDASLYYQ